MVHLHDQSRTCICTRESKQGHVHPKFVALRTLLYLHEMGVGLGLGNVDIAYFVTHMKQPP